MCTWWLHIQIKGKNSTCTRNICEFNLAFACRLEMHVAPIVSLVIPAYDQSEKRSKVRRSSYWLSETLSDAGRLEYRVGTLLTRRKMLRSVIRRKLEHRLKNLNEVAFAVSSYCRLLIEEKAFQSDFRLTNGWWTRSSLTVLIWSIRKERSMRWRIRAPITFKDVANKSSCKDLELGTISSPCV